MATQGIQGYLELKEEMKERKEKREEEGRTVLFLQQICLMSCRLSCFCSVTWWDGRET